MTPSLLATYVTFALYLYQFLEQVTCSEALAQYKSTIAVVVRQALGPGLVHTLEVLLWF